MVSNPDKLMFPGITKGEMVAYYERVGPAMLRHVAGRPLTLQRFPKGIEHKGFMQKNAADYFPDAIERVEISKREGGTTVYAVVHDAGSLAYLANLGTVAFHIWTSRVPDLDHPDRVIFDLDPSDRGASVVAAAETVRAFLADLDLPTGLMTSGSKGYHLVVPIRPTVHYGDVGTFSQQCAALLAHHHPDLMTDEFRIANREGRVFVDWLRNRQGQTGIAPWSLRARPGAPVATPIRWSELHHVAPADVMLMDVEDRLGIDPIDELAGAPVELEPVVRTVAGAVAEHGVEVASFDRFRS